MSERLFRVGDEVGYHDGGIPWRVIEPHAKQAIRNHSQSLERLHERGGLSWCEAAAVLEDRPWHKMDKDQARQRVLEIVAAMTPTPSTAEPADVAPPLDTRLRHIASEVGLLPSTGGYLHLDPEEAAAIRKALQSTDEVVEVLESAGEGLARMRAAYRELDAAYGSEGWQREHYDFAGAAFDMVRTLLLKLKGQSL